MSDGQETPDCLELNRDSEAAFNVQVVDERDAFEDLSVFDDAKLAIKTNPTDTTPIVVRQVVGPADLVINVAGNQLEAAALTPAELVNLPAGIYIMDVLLHETSTSRWLRTDPVYVTVIEGITDTP